MDLSRVPKQKLDSIARELPHVTVEFRDEELRQAVIARDVRRVASRLKALQGADYALRLDAEPNLDRVLAPIALDFIQRAITH